MYDQFLKLTFNPQKTELKDIFANSKSCGLWGMYRKHHIISQNGLPFLNQKCREIMNKKFTKESARKWLENFCLEMNEIEMSSNDFREWISYTIPFLTGEKEFQIMIGDTTN